MSKKEEIDYLRRANQALKEESETRLRLCEDMLKSMKSEMELKDELYAYIDDLYKSYTEVVEQLKQEIEINQHLKKKLRMFEQGEHPPSA